MNKARCYSNINVSSLIHSSSLLATSKETNMDQHEQSPRGLPSLQFDPDKHPHATLKAFNEFVEQYEFRYEAQYPEPPKNLLDNAILRWKTEHEGADPNSTQQLGIRNDIIARDKVRKLLGFFATLRLQQDWKAAEPVAENRQCTWADFLKKMRAYYKPTANATLRNYEFRQLFQRPSETFGAFCNRVEEEGKTCTFCDCAADANCTSTNTAVRDQIVIGTHAEKIRERALLKAWPLDILRSEGMKLESAHRGEEQISQTGAVNKVGKYAYKNMGKSKADAAKSNTNGANNNNGNNNNNNNSSSNNNNNQCFRCGDPFTRSHIKNCPAMRNVCDNCGTKGHYPQMCRKKDVKATAVEPKTGDGNNDSDGEPTYAMNIWRVKKSTNTSPRFKALKKDIPHHNFKTHVVIGNKLAKLLADTGALVSVCGMRQAKEWGIPDRLQPSSAKIRPYQSAPIPVRGVVTVGVTYNNITIPVEFHVLPGSCEPILAGRMAEELNIIVFNGDRQNVTDVYSMVADEIDTAEGKKFYNDIQEILTPYPHCFTGIGCLKDHQVKFYINDQIKPVVVPRRPVPYHLKNRVDKALKEMLDEGVIEPQPRDEPAPWVSAPVFVVKQDGSIRITLDARNINKAIQANNSPIPRVEEIKAQLSGAKYFSKMDLKSAYWQLELHPSVRYLTVFECNGELYRYKRLLMGVKPAQGELSMALRPIFAHIPDVQDQILKKLKR